jgi:hypothetical protein
VRFRQRLVVSFAFTPVYIARRSRAISRREINAKRDNEKLHCVHERGTRYPQTKTLNEFDDRVAVADPVSGVCDTEFRI